MLGKIGEIYYYTKRNKYAVIYVNQDEKDSMIEEIRKLKLVKYVEESIFENNILLNEQELESVK